MSHNRKISVIGLGYVGLPVAMAFAKQGPVIGLDINPQRITELKQGVDKTNEISGVELKDANIVFTAEPNDIKTADFHIVAVPTPIDDSKQPDLSALLSASRLLGPRLKKGDIVVYESTVYPGATEEVCVPVLEEMSDLRCGHDFFIAYSPERINPGDKNHTLSTVVKVVSAQNDEILDVVEQVYRSIVTAGVHRAPSIKVAEAAKVIENTQRDLNIALMNELALIFDRLGIDTGDVLTAAGSKWNFLPFTPGLVGGHCIGVDPYYLTYKASQMGYTPQVILAGRSINGAMGRFIASRVIKALIKSGYNVKECRVAVLGFTFKENVPDTRNTRIIDIVNELRDYKVDVSIHDPLADKEQAFEEYGITIQGYENITPCQAVVLAVSHDEYISQGWELIKSLLQDNKGVVFDIKHVLNRESMPTDVQLERL